MRKNIQVIEKVFWKFDDKGCEFAKHLRSLEQFIQIFFETEYVFTSTNLIHWNI